MADLITYDGFLNLIESMVERRESGTLYIRTDTNRSVSVGLLDGNIAALVAGPKRGLAAIATILQMSQGTFRRDDSPLSFHSGDLPPTRDILTLLKNRPAQPAAQMPPSDSPAPGSAIYSEQAAKILCEILHDYVGPVAPIICEDVTENGAKLRTSADLEKAIESLAEEIDSSAESTEFIQRARTDLGKMLS